MGESPANQPLTPQECVAAAIRHVEAYLDKGACVSCALNIAASDYDIDGGKLATFYMDHVLTRIDLYDPED